MKQLLTIAVLLLGFSSCKKPNDSTNLFNSFDRKGMLMNQANTLILPAFADFASSTDSLKASAATFIANPSSLTLQNVQNSWLNTALNLKRVELYQFGPIDNHLLYGNLDFWPARNTDVESFISANNSFTAPLIESSGTIVKGSPVIEYLLFNSNALSSFTSASDAQKRKDYLNALCSNLSDKALLISNEWINSYAATFNSKDAQAIDGSINISINEFIELLEYIKNTKVGKPFGKKDGTKYPDQVEAYYSGKSVAFIKVNLQEMKRLFNGGSGTGYDDFLDHMNAKTDAGAKLSEKINTQLDVCIAKCDAFSTPLSSAVNSNTQQVDDLYLALKELNVYLKVDLVNSLGITLTFSDNDGD